MGKLIGLWKGLKKLPFFITLGLEVYQHLEMQFFCVYPLCAPPYVCVRCVCPCDILAGTPGRLMHCLPCGSVRFRNLEFMIFDHTIRSHIKNIPSNISGLISFLPFTWQITPWKEEYRRFPYHTRPNTKDHDNTWAGNNAPTNPSNDRLWSISEWSWRALTTYIYIPQGRCAS